MERYGYVTCTLTLQADQLLRCRETAATDLKLVRLDDVTMTSLVIMSVDNGGTVTNEIGPSANIALIYCHVCFNGRLLLMNLFQ